MTFEPASILKKESNMRKDSDRRDFDLVAVQDPAMFKFDDELDLPDQGAPPEDDGKVSGGMRLVQSKQAVYPDSLDPRQPVNHMNEDLAYNKVYTGGSKDGIVVDFSSKEENKTEPDINSNVPGVFSP